LLADIYSHPLDVGLAFKQLSVTRPSERSTLDQPIFNWLSGAANGRPADRIGWSRVVLSWAGLARLVGENQQVGSICRPPHTNCC
jgi:hypothetical protein